MLIDGREYGWVNRCSDENECVWLEDLVLRYPCLQRLCLLAHASSLSFYPTYFCDSTALDIRIQFLQQLHRLFSAKLAQRVIVEEEVDAEVCFCDDRRVEDAEVANTRQNEVLESFNASHARAIVDE